MTASTIGAMTRQMASLTRNADSAPASKVTVTSSANGRRACSIASVPSARKTPLTLRWATTIIMPMSSATVS